MGLLQCPTAAHARSRTYGSSWSGCPPRQIRQQVRCKSWRHALRQYRTPAGPAQCQSIARRAVRCPGWRRHRRCACSGGLPRSMSQPRYRRYRAMRSISCGAVCRDPDNTLRLPDSSHWALGSARLPNVVPARGKEGSAVPTAELGTGDGCDRRSPCSLSTPPRRHHRAGTAGVIIAGHSRSPPASGLSLNLPSSLLRPARRR